MVINHCEGCAAECLGDEKNTDGSCPCVICIVKMMCDTSCSNWEIWYDLKYPEQDVENKKGEIVYAE